MLGKTLQELPSPLHEVVGSPVGISKDQFRRFLVSSGTSEAVLGGSLDEALSRIEAGFEAIYFVIHDTSTPNYGRDFFPGDINGLNWSRNDLCLARSRVVESHWTPGRIRPG
jgi:hypothetical protein